ncbi:hypothetical protein FG383_08875 [Psychrobacillus soli]|uniref:Uncharacterized protein n=1 Tax=Psychrobacillus soli TaxID=1543965 RepID=A0A544TDF9_9BACI|nr:hypothetical protein FG383_08875 [Psychrobacillus soli]
MDYLSNFFKINLHPSIKREHECVLATQALESDPVDPRL